MGGERIEFGRQLDVVAQSEPEIDMGGLAIPFGQRYLMRPGSYELAINAEGYHPYRQPLTVTDEDGLYRIAFDGMKETESGATGQKGVYTFFTELYDDPAWCELDDQMETEIWHFRIPQAVDFVMPRMLRQICARQCDCLCARAN